MILKVPLLSAFLLCQALLWNRSPRSAHAFVDVAVEHGRRSFQGSTRKSTELNPHRFNGGYDPSSPLAWTPLQAAEFTIFHDGTPHHAGMQLKSTIQHWGGADLAEFLTRLYLGDLVNDTASDGHRNGKKVVYEPRNVRTPQWEGLETREGILALKDLLKESLSKESLSAQEVARFAEAFLLKDYRWPVPLPESNATSLAECYSNLRSAKIEFENDSFYGLGHSRTIARVLLAIRKERGYNEFNSNDIALMVTLPEHGDKGREEIPMQMIDFFRTVSAYTSLTAKDKAKIVQRMAMSGWLSGGIPNFMAELLPDESLSENHSVDEIWKSQGDAFLDFPTKATLLKETNAKERKKTSAVELAVARVRKVVGKKSRSSPAKKTPTAEDAKKDAEDVEKDSKDAKKDSKDTMDTMGSELDELVQSYWKKVEVTTSPPKKKKKPVTEYGVPKTKSVKKRKIPEEKLAINSKKKEVVTKT